MQDTRVRTLIQVVLVVKKKKKILPTSAGDIRDVGSIPGSGRSPGGGHSNPLQYSCLENTMDSGILEEPGRLYSVGSQRVRHDGNDFSSVTQSCPILCDLMDCSTPGLPVHRQLLEFTQTHVHGVSDAIQPSHPLSAPSSTFNLSQHQGLFK